MKAILFVDDEQVMLDRMKSWFEAHQPSWQTYFFNCAKDAVSFLEGSTIDCIVSNVNMPDNNGAQLLSHVAARQPSAVRVALSDRDDAELALESLHATHRFITNVDDAAYLNQTIECSFELRERLADPSLQTLITGITTLPVLPEIYDRIMLELASETFSIDVISRIIESDISLTATLLKVVNSPYYGLVRHIESPSHAVKMLGVEVVKNILLTEKVVSQFQQFSPAAKRVSILNIEASIRGVLANRFARIAKLTKRQIDHCQMAGMLSSLGELVIETRMINPEAIAAQPQLENLIGSSILGLWSLPDAIVESVLRQNEPDAPTGEPTAMHVLHAVRHLEAAFSTNDFQMDKNFNSQQVFADYPLADSLREQWFDCFCDYHLDLKLAS